MTHAELEDLKNHLKNPPIGHGHAPIEFGDGEPFTNMSPEDATAYHMNAHGVFHPEDLHEVK